MPKLETPEIRFWKKVDIKSQNECWNWIGYKNKHGYGVMAINRDGKALVYAHRLSWIINKKTEIDKLCICHKCDNPSCVNPNHLFIGTQKDNVTDMFKKKRGYIHFLQKQTHCKRGHSYSGSNLYITSKKTRVCIACKNLNKKKNPN